MKTRSRVFVALAVAPLTLFPLFLGVMLLAAYIVKFVTDHSIGPIAAFNIDALRLPAFITALGYAVTTLIAGPVVLLSLPRQGLRFNRVMMLGAVLGGATPLVTIWAGAHQISFTLGAFGWILVFAGVAGGTATARVFWSIAFWPQAEHSQIIDS